MCLYGKQKKRGNKLRNQWEKGQESAVWLSMSRTRVLLELWMRSLGFVSSGRGGSPIPNKHTEETSSVVNTHGKLKGLRIPMETTVSMKIVSESLTEGRLAPAVRGALPSPGVLD